jgi:hypothetical protein
MRPDEPIQAPFAKLTVPFPRESKMASKAWLLSKSPGEAPPRDVGESVEFPRTEINYKEVPMKIETRVSP